MKNPYVKQAILYIYIDKRRFWALVAEIHKVVA